MGQNSRRPDWIEKLVIGIAVPAMGYLFYETTQLGYRVSKLEGQFETFMALRSEVQALRQDVGSIQSDIKGIGPPRIRITEVPAAGQGPDSQGVIGGKVEGVEDTTALKVVLYAHTDKWYVQPDTTQPLTPIERDGSWRSTTYPGSEYAALLVKPEFHPLAQSQSLPTGSDVLSRDVAQARKNP